MKNKKLMEEYRTEREVYGRGKVKAMAEALDSKLDGNVFYDFWWWNIWSNLKIPFRKIKDHRNNKCVERERKIDGVSREDAWALNEYLYEVTYKGCLLICKDLWGDLNYPLSEVEVERMGEEQFTVTQDKTFCLALQRYIKAYEEYRPYYEYEGFPSPKVDRPKNNFLKRFFLPGKCFHGGTTAVLDHEMSREERAAIQKYGKTSVALERERKNAFAALMTKHIRELYS